MEITGQHGTPRGVPGGSDGKESAGNAEDPDSIPGLGRSPGEGNGNLLQYSCLENPMDGEALHCQQKQDQELTVAQIMNSLLPNSELN